MGKHEFSLIVGNQNIMASFKFTNPSEDIENDYKSVNKYIERYEKKIALLQPFRAFLNLTGTRKLYQFIKNKIS